MKKLTNLVLLLVGIVIGYAMNYSEPSRTIPTEKIAVVLAQDTTVVEEPETNEEVIYRVLTSNGICEDMAMMVVAQAKHESASFNSRLFKKTNNPFGMMHPRRRQTTSKGTLAMFDHTSTKGFAVYSSIEDAALDYVYYLDCFKYPKDFKTVSSYVSFLKKKRYFEADEALYLNAVRTHYNKLEIKTLARV